MAKFLIVGKKMKVRFFLLSILILFLTHCMSYDFSRRIVQQGNLLPQSKIEQLKIGMPKENVAILMGTSLLSPLFDNNRWDYAYTRRVGNQPLEIRHVSLYFSHNILSKIQQS